VIPGSAMLAGNDKGRYIQTMTISGVATATTITDSGRPSFQ